MGCCFSKKRKNRLAPGARRCEPEDRDPPSPEEETVKEVLSETSSAKPTRLEPKPVANVAPAAEERGVKKAKEQEYIADAAASDLGSCVSLSLATDEQSEAASESSVATSSVAGPERSPGRRPPSARRRPVSADLGPARRDRAVAASYGVRSRSARASPSPPPRDRSVRPSPAAKRPSSEHRRAASPAAPPQRKPPAPARPSGRVSPRRAQEPSPPPPPPVSPPSSPPPSSQAEDDAVTAASEHSVPDGSAGGEGQGGRDGDGKESLENPLVSLECFIFL